MSISAPPSPDLEWDAVRGVPRSARFDDIYHSDAGALAQAHHVFLDGCELPRRWQGQPRFCILETGFGLGINFLATWQAWLDDPQRCDRLHLVSIEAYPVQPEQITAAMARADELRVLLPLAEQLARRFPRPLLAGLHRLRFTHPQQPGQSVTLTLVIGDAAQMLPRLHLQADAAYLDGFSPAKNPQLWQPRIFKGVARLLKPQALAATWSIASAVRKGLTEAGFILTRRPGLPPKRDALQARLEPWSLRRAASRAPEAPAPATPAAPPATPATPAAAATRRAVVVGAGVAGTAASWALAQRGWQVTLIDAAPRPAAGASGLPVGLCVPHVSPDDAIVSRLTRAGAAWMRHSLQDLGLPGSVWQGGPIWQVHGLDPEDEVIAAPQPSLSPPAQTNDRAAASCAPEHTGQLPPTPQWADLPGGYSGLALHHAHGLRIQGAPALAAWRERIPRLQLRCGVQVAQLRRHADGWQLLDRQGLTVAQAELIVLACAMSSADLLQASELASAQQAPQLTPVRGQITLGRWPDGAGPTADEAPRLITGHGHFIGNWQAEKARADDAESAPQAQSQPQWDWAMGSSFERNDSGLDARSDSDQVNLDKLRLLAPDWAMSLAPAFTTPLAERPATLAPWVQVRATTADRLPLAGAVPDWNRVGDQAASALHLATLPRLPGLYTLCGLGARGLSLAALCAELIASDADGEPWPLDTQLAEAIDPARFELKRRRRTAD